VPAATYLITLTFCLSTPGVAEATAGGFPAISAAPRQFPYAFAAANLKCNVASSLAARGLYVGLHSGRCGGIRILPFLKVLNLCPKFRDQIASLADHCACDFFRGLLPPRTRHAVSDPSETHKTVILRETLNGAFQVEIRSGGVSFLADQSPAVGGRGSGPDPYDLLCGALGACTSMTVRLFANQRRWPLSRVRVAVTYLGKNDTKWECFERILALDGDLTADQRSQLLAVAEGCPVHVALTGRSTVATSFGDIGNAQEETRLVQSDHFIAMQERLRTSGSE
jgi:putative redox protein